MNKTLWRVFFSFAIAMLFISTVFASLNLQSQAGAESANQSTILNRAYDPVIVAGAQLFDFNDMPLAELALYAYQDGIWQPIPFQFDEVNITGTYVISEDGLLDENDELVFMGGDAGIAVTTANWPNDAESQLHARYTITVTDPLNPSNQAWVYLYRSSTLPRSGESYLSWNEAAQTMTTISYTIGFEPEQFVGVASLAINGSADILDRQKIYADVAFDPPILPPFNLTFTEESVTDLFTLPLTITIPYVGPVRAIGGAQDGAIFFSFYGSRVDLGATVDLSDLSLDLGGLEGDVHFNMVRTSLDLRDPAVSGMAPARYYDSNTPNGVLINGSADPVAFTPFMDWFQYSGAEGTVVVVTQLEPGTGIATNYYKDSSVFNPEDTGDGRSYGDAGIQLDDLNPSTEIGLIYAALTAYVLPHDNGNVGNEYENRFDNPLYANTHTENFLGATSTPTTTPSPSPTPTATPLPPQPLIYLPIFIRQ